MLAVEKSLHFVRNGVPQSASDNIEPHTSPLGVGGEVGPAAAVVGGVGGGVGDGVGSLVGAGVSGVGVGGGVGGVGDRVGSALHGVASFCWSVRAANTVALVAAARPSLFGCSAGSHVGRFGQTARPMAASILRI